MSLPRLTPALRRLSIANEQRSHGRSHVLHETLRGFVQRRDISVMSRFLPPSVVKEEIVLTIRLTKKQKSLTQEIFKRVK